MSQQSPQFGELRSLLQQRPSPRVWELVTGLLWRWPSIQELEHLALPYAHEHFNRWPDALRVVPRTWLEALHAQDPRLSPALFSLCATVDYQFWLYDRLDCAQVAQLLSTSVYGQHIRAMWLDSSIPLALEGIFAALNKGPHLAHVEQLALGMPPQEIAYAHLSGAPWFEQLTHFWLKRGRLNGPRFEDWLLALTPPDGPVRLRHLCLIEQQLGDGVRAWERLMRWEGWPLLERLHLFGCFVDGQADGFVEALLSSFDTLALRTLDLGGDQLTDAALAAISRSHALPKLELLAVHLNTITPAGLDALCLSDALPSLRTVLAPHQVILASHHNHFAQRGVTLIATDDPRPTATQADIWF